MGNNPAARRLATNTRKRKQHRWHSGPWRAAIFSLIVLASLASVAFFLGPTLVPRQAPPATGYTVDLTADMGGFSMPVVRAKVNEPITVRLTSLDTEFHTDGGGRHQFAVDELGVNIIAPPKGRGQATFTPTEAGTYEFYCDICCGGRANPMMVGKFVVEA